MQKHKGSAKHGSHTIIANNIVVYLLGVNPPRCHRLSQLHPVNNRHFHFLEQFVQLIVGGFGKKFPSEVLFDGGCCVFAEGGILTNPPNLQMTGVYM